MRRDVLLLIEDDSGDVLLFERTLRRMGSPLKMEVVSDGADAVKYLLGEPPFQDREKFKLPKLLVMDLFMARMNGFELLGWVRSQPILLNLPVLVLTGTMNSEDVRRAYALGASLCLEKTSDMGTSGSGLQRALEFFLSAG